MTVLYQGSINIRSHHFWEAKRGQVNCQNISMYIVYNGENLKSFVKNQ